MRDTILELADQRQEVLLLTAFYILQDSQKRAVRKELKQIEKD